MAQELDAISVNIYADVSQLESDVKKAAKSIDDLQERTRKKVARLGVGFRQGDIAAMDKELDTLAKKPREITVNLVATPDKESKAKFKGDIETALNRGQPIRVKTTVQLDKSNIDSMRQAIKNAVAGIKATVNVEGRWMGWEGGEPPTDIINIRGGGSGPGGAPAGGTVHIQEEVKKALNEALSGERVAQPAPSSVVERPETKHTEKSSTVVGGPAGTTRTTEEVTKKTTTEAVPSSNVVANPKPRADQMQPAARETTLEPGYAQGATVMSGKHPGGQSVTVTKGMADMEEKIRLDRKEEINDLLGLLKKLKIGFDPDLGTVGVEGRRPSKIANFDFSKAVFPKKGVTPEMFGQLASMGIDATGDPLVVLSQLREKLTAAVDAYNAIQPFRAMEEDVNGPQLRPGKRGQTVAAHPESILRLAPSPDDLSPAEQRANEAKRAIMFEQAADLTEGSIPKGEMALGFTRGDIRRRERVKGAIAELKEQLSAGEAPFQAEMEEMAALAKAAETNPGGRYSVKPRALVPGDIAHAGLRVGMDRGLLEDLLDQPGHDAESFQRALEGAYAENDIGEDSDLIQNFRDEIAQLNPMQEIDFRTAALNIATGLEETIVGLQKGDPKFARQVRAARKGERSNPGLKLVFDAINATRSRLGRLVPLDVNNPEGEQFAVGGELNRLSEEDLGEIAANQARAESSRMLKLFEEFSQTKNPKTGRPFGLPAIRNDNPVARDIQRVLTDRPRIRAEMKAAKKELRKGGPQLDEPIPDPERTKLLRRQAIIEGDLRTTDDESVKPRLAAELGAIKRELSTRPRRTRRQYLESLTLPQLPTLPAEVEKQIARGDLSLFRATPEYQDAFSRFVRERDEEDKDRLETQNERTSRAPRRKMRTSKPLDAMDLALRRGAIAEELTGGASGKHADNLRAELKGITEELDRNKTFYLKQEQEAILDKLSDSENPPTTAERRKLMQAYDLKSADVLESEADDLMKELQNPHRVGLIEHGEEAVLAKRQRATLLRRKYEITNPELPAYLQQFLAGGDEDLGEGPGATRRKARDPGLAIPTGKARLESTLVELEGMTPQLASGILRRKSGDTSVAQVEAALLYKQGLRAVGGQLVSAGGGPGGIQRVHVVNFKEIQSLLAKGGAAGGGSPQAGPTPAAVTANQPVTKLGGPSSTAQKIASRFFKGDIPFGVDPRVLEALEHPADAATIDQRLKELTASRETTKRTQELITSRSPTVAAGQALQALFGGRPEVITAIQQFNALKTEQGTLLRQRRVREQVTIPRLTIEREQAEAAGDTERALRKQDAIEKENLKTAFGEVRLQDIEDELPALKDQFEGFNPVLKSFTSLTLGAIGGTLLFGATLQAAQAGVQLIGAALKPGIELMTNYGEQAVVTSKALGELTSQAGGSAKAGVASALFSAGLPTNLTLRPELERAATVGAGLSALDQQDQLFKTAVNFRLNPNAGITFPVGGGPFGFNAENSALRRFKNNLGDVFQTQVFGALRLPGQTPEHDKAVIDAINDQFKDVGVKLVDEASSGLSEGALKAQRESLKQIDSEYDFLANQKVSEIVANQLEDRGLVLVGAESGKPLTGSQFQGALGGQIIEATKKSVDALIQAQEPQIQAQRATLQEQRQLNDRLSTVQFAVNSLENPPLPPGVGIPTGLNVAGAPQGPSTTSVQAFTQLQALRGLGQQQILDIVGKTFPERLDTVKSELRDINALSSQIAERQINLISEQQAHQVAVMNEQLYVAARNVRDLQALSGQGGGSVFGQWQRDILMANRQLTVLGQDSAKISLGISQRQLNLQRSLAGLGVAGETPEERFLRQKAVEEELKDQQRLLNNQGRAIAIQDRIIPLSFKVEDITLDRNFRDARKQLGLMRDEIRITADAAQAEEEIRNLSDLMQLKVNQLNNDIQAGVGDLNIEMQVYQQAVADTLGDWRKTRNVVSDIFQTLRGDNGTSGGGGTASNYVTINGVRYPDFNHNRVPDSKEHFATGGLFNTTGPVDMTVGEAGTETVAVLRNPRGFFASGIETGSVSLNINVTGNTVRNEADLDELVRRITNEVQYALAQQSALRGLRSPG